MKLKFINFILASALMVGSAQVFTSCKDNEADSVHELNKKDKALQKLIEENQSKIQDLRSDLIAETNNRVADVATLNGRIDDTNNKLTQLSLALGNCATKEEFNIVKGQMDQLIAAAGGDINKLVESIKTIEKNKLAIEQIDNILNAEGTGVIARITKLESAISIAQAAIGNLEETVNNHSELLTEVGNKAADALAKAIANESAINALTEAMEGLATKEELNFYVDSLGNELDQIAKTYASTQWVDANYAKKGDLLNYASKAELATAIAGVASQISSACANAVSTANQYTDQKIQDLIDHIEDYLPNNPGPSGSDWTEDQLKTLINNVLNAEGGVNDRLAALELEIAKLDEVNNKIGELTTRIEELAERLNGIVVHQAVSNAIGTFNLPIGVTNKLLLAYSGENSQPMDVVFPTSFMTMDGEGVVPADILNGVEKYTIEQNEFLMTGAHETGKGQLGIVYLTLNPNNVNYKNFNFSLKSSNTNYKGDAEVTLTPSNSELMLGYGRGESNGFYAAEVTVEEKYVPQYRFTLSSGFKSKVQSIISEPRSLASASTIASLSAALYSEVNGKLPALALSASWTEGQGENQKTLSVNSEYNIGATVVTPLSFQLFKTLEDQGKFDKIANKLRIPDLSKLPEKFDAKFDEMTGKLHIQLVNPEKPAFKVERPDFTITVSGITVNVPTLDSDDDPTVTVVTEVKLVDGEIKISTIEQPVEVAATVNPMLEQLKENLQNDINGMLGDLQGQLDGLNEEIGGMVDSINEQVNNMLGEMENNINNQLEDILADIKGQLNSMISGAIGRFDPVLDRMESIVNRMKNIIKYPSYYVQPCLVYKNNGNAGLISTNPHMPSVFTVSGSNPAVTLVPTTYTLEAAVPCYLKYVAVVEAINNSTKQNDAQAVKDANSVENMNKVLPSNVYTMPMVPLKLKKGYTYKIVYQAMDYSGIINGRDYYVTVK